MLSVTKMSNGLLIVDDDAFIRSVLRSFVEADGYRVCGEAADGIEAIERAAELQPDLILLDMYADDFGEKLASAIGVQVVLSKPEGLSNLGEHLRALLNPTDEPPALGSDFDEASAD